MSALKLNPLKDKLDTKVLHKDLRQGGAYVNIIIIFHECGVHNVLDITSLTSSIDSMDHEKSWPLTMSTIQAHQIPNQ